MRILTFIISFLLLSCSSYKVKTYYDEFDHYEWYRFENNVVFEDYPEVFNDMMNTQREVLDRMVMEDQSEGEADGSGFDFILYEEATIADPKGSKRVLYETSKTEAEGYGVAHTVHQAWTVLPAYRFTKVRTRLQGTINFAADGVAGTGSGSGMK